MLIRPHKGISELRRRVSEDPWVGKAARETVERADAMLGLAPATYALDSRGTLLDVARLVSDRMFTLGVGWLVSGSARFRRRIADELMSVASFPDWNRSHFLDTAEIMAAVAIGHGWTAPVLTRGEDRTILEGLTRSGLMPAKRSFELPSRWVSATNNWTVVCASASILGALAVRAALPALAEEILQPAKRTLAGALRAFEPDGGWHEGPTYWALATDYAVLALAALEACGDVELQVPDAFLATWRFDRALTSPAGLSFDYGDGILRPDRCHGLGWLASRCGDADAAAWQRRAPGAPRPFDVLWSPPPAASAHDAPRVDRFAAAGVSAVTDGNIWLGLKGGSNATNHSHLDLGTVVLEVAGERFLCELGREDYAMPGYFDPARRFGYFRAGTAAHNTIVFGGESQSVEATATSLGQRNEHSISAAYRIDDPNAPCRISRAVEIIPGRGAIIADRITPAGSGPVQADWLAHTQADVVIREHGAMLSLGETSLALTVAASVDKQLRLEPAPCPPGESDNSVFRRLRIPFTVGGEPVILTTTFSAGADIEELVDRGAELHAWLASRCP